MDRRDALTWITLELSEEGEEMVRNGTLVSTLRHDLKVGDDFPVFIPATSYVKDGSLVTILLMEGYAFVGSGLDDVKYFALERKGYITRVLSTDSGSSWRHRNPLTVPDSDIEEIRSRLQVQMSVGVRVGDSVKILHGRFKHLQGVVRILEGDNAVVKVVLRSLEALTTVPRGCLEPVSEISES